jgi:hypothetical protein
VSGVVKEVGLVGFRFRAGLKLVKEGLPNDMAATFTPKIHEQVL